MGIRGSERQSVLAETYSEDQIAAVLNGLGVRVRAETVNDFTALCPFHGNRHSPSFSVSKDTGKWICFNPSCAKSGNLIELVTSLTDRNTFQAMRYIIERGSGAEIDVVKRLRKQWYDRGVQHEFDQDTIDRMASDLWDSPQALDYLHNRGFKDETLDYFKVGYSDAQKMVAVPAHSLEGQPIGVIGRSVIDKRFKNSDGLHTSQFLFNAHRARRAANWVIINEASFDTMRVHQAGYPNVVATLGGSFSKTKVDVITRNFDSVVIMTDFDELQFPKDGNVCNKCPGECVGHNPGRDLGYVITSRLSTMPIYWATLGYKQVYSPGAKDASDMTDEDIATAIDNRTSHFEYLSWNIY